MTVTVCLKIIFMTNLHNCSKVPQQGFVPNLFLNGKFSFGITEIALHFKTLK